LFALEPSQSTQSYNLIEIIPTGMELILVTHDWNRHLTHSHAGCVIEALRGWEQKEACISRVNRVS